MKNKIYALVAISLLIPSFSFAAAGQGISTWPALVGDVADGDLLAGTDISDTSGSDNGTSKKITASQLKTYMGVSAKANIDDPTFTTKITSPQVNIGAASTTTGLINLYNSSKAFPFGLFALGADAPGIGWRFPATLPAGTYLVTVDTNGYMGYLDPSTLGGITESSTNTLTNKTYDVNGTGNNFGANWNIGKTWFTPGDADDPIAFMEGRLRTLGGMACLCLGGGTIAVDLRECDNNGVNCATTGAAFTCGSTMTSDSALTDSSIASNHVVRIFVGAPTGTVDQIHCQIWGTEVQ